MSLILSGSEGLSDVDGTAATPAIRGTDTNTGIFFPAADTIAFAEGGVESMRLDSSGNVGIGTSSPSSWGKLAVRGSITSGSENISASFSDAVNSTLNISHKSGLSGIYTDAGLWFGTANTERMRIDTSGNVGIGTSAPGVRFQVQQDQAANSYFDYYNVTNGGGVIWRQIVRNIANTGTTSVDIAKLAGGAFLINNNDTNAANYTAFGVGGSERARIDSSGRLLVGTTSGIANGTLCVRSNFNGAEACSFQGGSNNFIVTFHNTSGTLIGSITGSNGSTTSYNTSSDYRLKEDVRPMTGALARVAALKPVTYKWKEDGVAGEGFIAHELQEVVPQAVTGEKDAVNEDGSIKPQGIDTSFLVATLTAAIQELKAELDAVKTELAALKGTA